MRVFIKSKYETLPSYYYCGRAYHDMTAVNTSTRFWNSVEYTELCREQAEKLIQHLVKVYERELSSYFEFPVILYDEVQLVWKL